VTTAGEPSTGQLPSKLSACAATGRFATHAGGDDADLLDARVRRRVDHALLPLNGHILFVDREATVRGAIRDDLAESIGCRHIGIRLERQIDVPAAPPAGRPP